MNALSLFSGIGGIDLACDWAGIKTAAFCEREPFCQKVLRKHWPDIPIYDDVCTLTKERLEADGVGAIDIIHGGYPCQPFSLAGKREGTEDDRHLWPEVFRLIQALNPRWFVGENVAGHITLGLDIVLSDLDSIGYAAEAFVIPACAVDARHRRDRVFIVAHSKSEQDRWVQLGRMVPDFTPGSRDEDAANTAGEGLQKRRQPRLAESQKKTGTGVESKSERCSENVPDTDSAGLQGSEKAGNVGGSREKTEQQFAGYDQTYVADTNSESGLQTSEETSTIGSEWKSWDDARWSSREYKPGTNWWATEPPVGRVANGVPNRVDRLKALGNAVVPQQIYPILAAIKHIDDMSLRGEAI